MTKTDWLYVAGVVGGVWATVVTAQTPPPAGPTSFFQWTQPAASAAAAQALSYRYYVDGATAGTVVTGVTCTGTTTITCEAPVPALTPGNHTVQISAASTAGESAKSSPPFSFAYDSVVVPQVPVNLRIK
jgi:hypothetical protein